ncbi:hypothetical protein R1flu_001521 [Riccia fluitans]|uniref:SHSP domain-containing protein n=1 Tax=Riccia fluitans TaxID=41844 RepID=A0ABD1Y3V2_9MARC
MGLTREDVKVKIEDGETLEVSGERVKEEAEKTDIWHLLERTPGTFLRKFRLPENIVKDVIKAQVENGVLTIVIPKIPPPKPEVRAIEVQINAVKAQVENGVLTITLGSENLPKVCPPKAEVRRIQII